MTATPGRRSWTMLTAAQKHDLWLLMLTRQLATALKLGPDAWNHRPEMRRQEIELTGTVMGIFGFGGTGRAMARRAAAFGMTVNALERDPVPT